MAEEGRRTRYIYLTDKRRRKKKKMSERLKYLPFPCYLHGEDISQGRTLLQVHQRQRWTEADCRGEVSRQKEKEVSRRRWN
jgi:hypothetical protein